MGEHCVGYTGRERNLSMLSDSLKLAKSKLGTWSILLPPPQRGLFLFRVGLGLCQLPVRLGQIFRFNVCSGYNKVASSVRSTGSTFAACFGESWELQF